MIDKNKELEKIEDHLWDHYSGLPNPLWYAQNQNTDKKQEDNNSNKQETNKKTKI